MYPRLQFLTLDGVALSHLQQVEAALAGGVQWIQFRAKGLAVPAWIELAQPLAVLCRQQGAIFIVNDSVEVAHAVGASGVHLGAEDVAPAVARERLGPQAIIGVTLNTPRDLGRLQGAKVDYAGVGPWRMTQSKQKLAPVHTPLSLQDLIHAAGVLPTYAIGGVTLDDYTTLRGLGAHGIAVSGAIARSAQPIQAARELVQATQR
jgi:thiamine-phosphate pyrophosphorylase